MEIVKNMNMLKAMERAGHIVFHNQTGTLITGLYDTKKFKCYYINDGETTFKYKNKTYRTQYMSGCFYPYVIELNK